MQITIDTATDDKAEIRAVLSALCGSETVSFTTNPAPVAVEDTPPPAPAPAAEEDGAPTAASVFGTPTVEVTPAVAEDDAPGPNGIPWDARIHPSNKSRVKSGDFKYKPRLDPAVKEAVIAELRVAGPAAQTQVGYPEALQRVLKAAKPPAVISAAIVKVGQDHGAELANLPDLQDRPDLIPAFLEELGA